MDSSSKVWLSRDRLDGVFLIVTGFGDRETVLCIVVGFASAGMRIGDDTAVKLGDEVGLLPEATEATIGDVCGSLGTLLKGLKSQDGANLDFIELREDPLVSRE